MKNLAIALLTTLMLAACSSGTTSADLPQNVSGLFEGSFENSNNTQSGNITLNLSQGPDSTAVTGNFFTSDVVRADGSISCLASSTLTGSVTGLGVALTAGDTTFQLTVSNLGNTLSGTYISTSGGSCSGDTGSGTITVNR